MEWVPLTLPLPPFASQVDHELDTQNFEQFDEEGATHATAAAASSATTSSGGGGAAGGSGGGHKRVAAKADPNFIGYTYKNWEAVQPAGGESGGEGGRCSRQGVRGEGERTGRRYDGVGCVLDPTACASPLPPLPALSFTAFTLLLLASAGSSSTPAGQQVMLKKKGVARPSLASVQDSLQSLQVAGPPGPSH